MAAAAKRADPETDAFVISRAFDAPRDRVWRAWTEADRLKHWWGPQGCTVEHCAMDLRQGGLFHYNLRVSDGGIMWGRWLFREIAAPERLVFLSSFSDEAGAVKGPPWGGNWPPEIRSVVTFAEEGVRTLVTVRWTVETGTEADRAAFLGMFDSMRQGWSGTFDRFAEHLARA